MSYAKCLIVDHNLVTSTSNKDMELDFLRLQCWYYQWWEIKRKYRGREGGVQWQRVHTTLQKNSSIIIIIIIITEILRGERRADGHDTSRKSNYDICNLYF
jgi:hypothetical protein